jgi:hypothetical protein
LTDKTIVHTHSETTVDADGKITGLKYTQDGGDVCTSDRNYTLTTVVKCNAELTADPTTFTVVTTDKCNPTITFSHADGCPALSLNSLVAFFQTHPWIIAVFLIVFGLIVTFFGAKFL